MSFSLRRIFGCVRKGQARTANCEHSRWLGGSALVRLTAHIGPITNTMNLPSGSPHSQQRLCLTQMPSFSPSKPRNSGLPFT